MMGQKKLSKKRKLPTNFLDCPSLAQVVDFPPTKTTDDTTDQHGSTKPGPLAVVNTPVASEVVKEIFLDRFVKEIVKPFCPQPANKSARGGSFVMVHGRLQKQTSHPKSGANEQAAEPTKKQLFWRQRIRVGTNQCSRLLESCNDDLEAPKPSLLVLARDIYPPTMLVHVPVLTKKLGIPTLLLPGKASNEIGQALGIRKTSILLFMPSASEEPSDGKVASFVEFIISQIPKQRA